MLCSFFNPLNTELNPICHLLALLGVHYFLHISRIRVKQTASYSIVAFTEFKNIINMKALLFIVVLYVKSKLYM